MAEVDGEGDGGSEGPRRGLGHGGSEAARFDASQYAFFGKDVVDEVELGGLEDEEDGDDPSFVGINDEDYQFSSLTDRAMGEGLRSLSDIDDLGSTFSKLNRSSGEPGSTEVIGARGSFSRESSSAADWAQEPGFSNWLDRQVLEAEDVQDAKRWWSQPDPSSARYADSRPLYRTSSYPQQQQQQFSSTDPILVPKPSHTSFSSIGGPSKVPQNHSHHVSISSGAGFQMPFSAPNPSHFSQLHLPALPHGSPYGGNMAQFGPPGLSNNRQQNRWLDQSSFLSGDHANFLSNATQHQLPHLNGPVPSQLLAHQQQPHGLPQLQSSLSHISNRPAQMLGPHPSPQQMMNNFEPVLGIADFRDQRPRPVYRGKQNFRFAQLGFDTVGQKSGNGWPQFRSKYMTPEEIENILRMQLAATHSNDPYIDDYYHQACLAKRSAGSRMRHHFCPNVSKDLTSRPRAKDEPHAYLQVDALGRLPFSSIRRPRPLLEVESSATSGDEFLEQKTFVKPLDQEPMLAARIAIEDGFSLLLDVDDIDRLLQFSQPQDGSIQLRKKREVLLEGLAASLQLVDPLGPGTAGHAGLSAKDDLVFLRLVSLPKGRKFLSRYLNLLIPGSGLARVVCMAIFRHLRFLFGLLPLDSTAAETTVNLSKTVSSCVNGMDLNALSACLAAVVCSPEQPPLRPLGSSAGDGASVILKSLLERATELLTDRNTASIYNISNRNLWQASFNAFFEVLRKYCLSKYETIMQSTLTQMQNAVSNGSETTKAISREMPVDLLRASLPHTDEHQRKQLIDFARRSMPVVGQNADEGNNGPTTSQSVSG